MVLGDGIHEGAAGRKGSLYLLIWIRWPGSVTVFTPIIVQEHTYARTHTPAHTQSTPQTIHMIQELLCCFSCFSVQLTYHALFSKFSVIKLPAGLMCILAMSLNQLFALRPPFLSNHPPYTCSESHHLQLRSPLCPLCPSITHPSRHLWRTQYLSFSVVQTYSTSSFIIFCMNT